MGDLESVAIARIQEAARLSEFYYQKPLLLTYSGGKDSDVCLELCKRARVHFEVVHSLTTADAPETVYHVRSVFHELELNGVHCKINAPSYKGKRTSMWDLIPQKGIPPYRRKRWCCEVLKERATPHRCVVLGVRSCESKSRKDSKVAETQGKNIRERQTFDFDNGDERIFAPCQIKAELKIHPIVDWNTGEVWSFLHDANVNVNECYYMGFNRVGCVGCPMAGKFRWREFRQWPKIENLYRNAFSKMLDARKARGKPTLWKTSDDVFRWWMDDKNLDGQLNIDGWEE